MAALRHIVFAASYCAVALAVALAVPLAGVGIDRPTALLLGLVVFVFGGLLHEFYARMEQADLIDHQLRQVTERQDRILATLEAAARGGGLAVPEPVVAAVVNDSRMLKTLAERLPPTIGRDGPAPASGPALTALPPPRDDGPILDGIRDALRTDRVDVFLQPVVSLPQRKHRFYEVFSRIRLEDGSYLPPDRYLPVAERQNLIGAIDNLLLFRCVQLLRETEKRHQNVGFFCNISAATLNDDTFMREFVGFMGQNPNLAQKIIFELSQADLMRGGVFATTFLDGLRRLGFRFSMDQVDSFDIDWDQLAAHEIRYVKLDAARLLDPEGRFAAPDSVTELKRQLDRHNIDLIVEKIETDPQLLELLELYIDFGQGYLFGEPRLARRTAA